MPTKTRIVRIGNSQGIRLPKALIEQAQLPAEVSIQRSEVTSARLNRASSIVAPMTTDGQAYPWRVPCRFQRQAGFVVLDQLRTVDIERLVKRLGRLAPDTFTEVMRGLQELFADE